MLKEMALPTPLPLGTGLCCNVLALTGSGHSRCMARSTGRTGTSLSWASCIATKRVAQTSDGHPQTVLPTNAPHTVTSPTPISTTTRRAPPRTPGPATLFYRDGDRPENPSICSAPDSRGSLPHRGCARSGPPPARSTGGKIGGQGLPDSSSKQLDPPPKRVPRLACPRRRRPGAGGAPSPGTAPPAPAAAFLGPARPGRGGGGGDAKQMARRAPPPPRRGSRPGALCRLHSTSEAARSASSPLSALTLQNAPGDPILESPNGFPGTRRGAPLWVPCCPDCVVASASPSTSVPVWRRSSPTAQAPVPPPSGWACPTPASPARTPQRLTSASPVSTPRGRPEFSHPPIRAHHCPQDRFLVRREQTLFRSHFHHHPPPTRCPLSRDKPVLPSQEAFPGPPRRPQGCPSALLTPAAGS